MIKKFNDFLNESNASRKRIEIVDVDFGSNRTNAVDAANPLHEPSGVPRRIVVHDDVGAVEVDALGQDFGGKENVVVVRLLGDAGVKVGADPENPLQPEAGTRDADRRQV